MARYIDGDKLLEKAEEIEWFNESTGYYDHINIVHAYDVETAPTADVVPKSEVERLVDKWIGEKNLTKDEKTLRLIEVLQDEARRYERYYFNHEYDKLIAEAKTEVAREIFAEIERTCVDTFGYFYVGATHGAFAELKKKYTEREAGAE